ncbi:dihydroxyacetone kinase subunit DhaL [Halodesulfovibrio sp.]|jgi:dihydroxyacetone kinase-like protein|uniref:dihydroxyacetone kinase subunit DhaL n=1 Tax=Halodesulfovibrio sp. TaxID=1912772 RepID=UPI0025E4B986|nr:dihydroxyacetone kinase subunit DhaL [Halodesulfovibrio sp.]MCT4626359.1 dihydroxyacetone kinase subunit DhaL [Halodesulfovibrio sp.]
MFTKETAFTWYTKAAAKMSEHKEELHDLDAAIGDGDHGINMDRGFTWLLQAVPEMQNLRLGEVLKTSGMILLSSVGGASGPLYGTLFLKGSATVGERDALTSSELFTFFDVGVAALIARGRTKSGDKTMYDTWEPMLLEYKKQLESGATMVEIMRACVDAAAAGMTATIPMLAQKGRASYLGERSIGHQDPGATSSFYLIQALYESIRE